MANSKHIGLITCPHCGNESATVHEQQTGTKKGRRYYRCYESVNGNVQLCGTIQCIGPTGQAFINANMRPIGQNGTPEPAPEPIGQPQPVPEPEAPQEPEAQPAATRRRRIGSFLASLGGDD